jgi:CRISPR-associated protein Cst2
MAPKSIVARLTPSLIAGFNTYGFDEQGNFSELSRIHDNDLPADEFWIGGELARTMNEPQKAELSAAGVNFYDNPQTLLADLTDEFVK